MMCGGHSALKEPEPELVELVMGLRNDIETQASHKYETFEVVGFTSQVVAGTIFRVHVRVAHAEHEHIYVQIFRPLPHTGQPAQVQVVQMTPF